MCASIMKHDYGTKWNTSVVIIYKTICDGRWFQMKHVFFIIPISDKIPSLIHFSVSYVENHQGKKRKDGDSVFFPHAF